MMTVVDEAAPTDAPASRSTEGPVATSGVDGTDDFLPLYRTPLTHCVGAFIGYLLIALLMHASFIAPLVRGSEVPIGGGVDGPFYFWRWLSALKSIESAAWLETGAFFPFTLTGTWSEPFFLPALFGYPFVYLGLPTTSVFGALLLAATIATGYCTYRLGYQLTGNGYAAFIGGAIFATSACFGHGGLDTPLAFAFFIPLVTSAALGVLARPTFGAALRVGILIAAAFYSSTAVAAVALITALGLTSALLVVHPGRLGPREFLRIFSGTTVGLLPIVPFLAPALSSLPLRGESLSTDILKAATTSLREFVTSPSLSALSCPSAATPGAPCIASGTLVLLAAGAAFFRLVEARILRRVALVYVLALVVAGISAIPGGLSLPVRHLLAASGWVALLAGVILLYRLGAVERRLSVTFVSNRAIIAGLAFAGAVGYLVAVGPIDATPPGSGLSLYRALEATLFRLIPLTLPSYGALGALFCLTIMATFTLVRAFRRAERHLWIVPFVGLALILENNRSCPHESTIPAAGTIFSRLTEMEPGVVAVLPMREVARDLSFQALRQARRDEALVLHHLHLSGMPTVNGAALRPPPHLTALARVTRDFPSAAAIKALATIPGLRYVIVRAGAAGLNTGELMNRAALQAEAVRYIDADSAGNYLFEFIATTRVRSDFEILVPVAPHGIVTLELQALYEKNEPNIPINVVLGNDPSLNLTATTIPANGQWQTLSLPIPAMHTRGAPAPLRIDVPERARVFIRNPRLVSSRR